MKTHSNSNGMWYGPEQISSLIKSYAPNVTPLMPVSALLGLTKQLDQIQQNGKYFIPLNINCLSQNFIENANNHWAGLYIIKDTYQTSVLYLDPMGKPMNSKLESQIKDKLTTDSVGQSLLHDPIQYVEDKGIQLAGNTNDCVPMLVYCVACMANGKNMKHSIKNSEQSTSFGQFLRESFDKNVGFEEIYQTLQASQESAPVIKKVSSSKVTSSSDTEDVDLFVSGILKAVEVGGAQADQAIGKVRKMGEHSSPTTYFERIMEAIKGGDQKCAKELINKIAIDNIGELSRSDVIGETLLHMAISAGYREVAKALLNKNPNLANTIDKNGKTALHIAVDRGVKKNCELLIPNMSLKAIDAKDKDNKTAWNVAEAAKNEKLCKFVCTQVIHQKIEKGNELIVNNHDQIILAIGRTGVGKSTLVNYLINPENLEVVLYENPANKFSKGKGKGKLVIQLKQPSTALNLPKIGHTKNSETTIPNKWQSTDGKTVYWDCPGFEDANGPAQDIPNAFYIRKIFTTAKNVKLVLVVDKGELETSRANEIKKLADTLGTLFDNSELTHVMSGLSLVITKATKAMEVGNIKDQIYEMLKADCFNTYSKGKELLLSLILPKAEEQLFDELIDEFFQGDQEIKVRLKPFVGSEDKIALFREPENTGELTKEDKKTILEVIENTKFIDKPKANIAVSDKSKLFIVDLAKKAEDTLNKEIAFLSGKVIENYHQKCRELKVSKNLSDLKKLQDNLVVVLKMLIDSDINNVERNIKTFTDMLALVFHDELFSAERLCNNLQYLKFFKEIKADINLDIAPCMEGFTVARDTILKYTYIPQEKIVQIRGRTVTSKDIIVAINDDCVKELKAVEVYAEKELVLSSNLKHEKLKGINFSALAPYWKITKQVTIDLSGINGLPHAKQKADNAEGVVGANPDGSGKSGNNGSDGLPGLPGEYGGNFFGAGQEFTNIANLTINVSGGIGGRGQDGGDGSNGTNATKHGSKELIQGRARAVLKSMTEISTKPLKYLEIYESGAKGGVGGDSGKAGKGGKGGFAGIAKLLCVEDIANQPTILNLAGNQGIPGAPGKNGIGGESGKIYYGMYVNEPINLERIGTAALTSTKMLVIGGPALLVMGVMGLIGIGVGSAGLIAGELVGGLTGLAGGFGGYALAASRPDFAFGLVLGSAVAGSAALKELGVLAGAVGVLVAGMVVVYNSYTHSGWQGKIGDKEIKAASGQSVPTLNDEGIKSLEPVSKEALVKYDYIIEQYKKYLDMVSITDKAFIRGIATKLLDSNPIPITQENNLLSNQAKNEASFSSLQQPYITNQEEVTSLQSHLDECVSGKLVIIEGKISLQKGKDNKILWHNILNTKNTTEENVILEQLATLAPNYGIELVENDAPNLAGEVTQFSNDFPQ